MRKKLLDLLCIVRSKSVAGIPLSYVRVRVCGIGVKIGLTQTPSVNVSMLVDACLSAKEEGWGEIGGGGGGGGQRIEKRLR